MRSRIWRWDGQVESRGRLVGHDQLGIQRHGEGDDHALCHAAAQLVGVAVEHTLGIGDPDGVEHRQRGAAYLTTAPAAMRPDDVAELALDPQHTVERPERVLGHEPDARPPEPAELAGPESDEVGALEADRSRGDAPRWLEQADDRTHGGGLAAARFTHEADRLAFSQRERHTVDSVHRAAPAAELHVQVGYLQQRRGRRGTGGGHGAQSSARPIRRLTPSATMLKATIVTNTIAPGKNDTHH